MPVLLPAGQRFSRGWQSAVGGRRPWADASSALAAADIYLCSLADMHALASMAEAMPRRWRRKPASTRQPAASRSPVISATRPRSRLLSDMIAGPVHCSAGPRGLRQQGQRAAGWADGSMHGSGSRVAAAGGRSSGPPTPAAPRRPAAERAPHCRRTSWLRCAHLHLMNG